MRMNNEWRGTAKKRFPLKKGDTITLGNIVFENDDTEDLAGRGGTCLVYHGHVVSGKNIIPDTPVIIKEFYPYSDDEVFDIERDAESNELIIADWTRETETFKAKQEQFELAIANQELLSKSEVMEIAVRPLLKGCYGNTQYVVSALHRGKPLDEAVLDTIENRMLAAVCVAESMDILHNEKYVMLDFKPENLMWIDQPAMIRILDVDSIVKIDDEKTLEEERLLFTNERYASSELQYLIDSIREGASYSDIRNVYEAVLDPISNIYSIGVYLYELFWEMKREENLIASFYNTGDEELLERFLNIYSGNSSCNEKKLKEIGTSLIRILRCIINEKRTIRRKKGYSNAGALMKELNDLYFSLTTAKYVPRKEVAKANGTYAAYNLLQVHPLFRYIKTSNENRKELQVVLAGSHAMRKDMLSAIISIGQMWETELHIHILEEDAEIFWNEYTSLQNNHALLSAVTIEKDGQIIQDAGGVNTLIVERPLAHIHLLNGDAASNIRHLCQKDCGRYFVLMNEKIDTTSCDKSDTGENLELLKQLITEVEDKEEKYFIGYLYSEEEEIIKKTSENIDVYAISTDSYNESYNEKMFSERVFKMGLLVHAYYCGYMDQDKECDMQILKSDFKKDPYSMASSERTAIHSIYKMASLGIDKDKPGRYRHYFETIYNDASELEKLAWLEHLSWTAYMLTTGAIPVFSKIEDFSKENFEALFNAYAYKDRNDWKDKTDALHIRHPYLVSSKAKRILGKKEWNTPLSEKEIALLDPLDQISYRIYLWYKSKKQITQTEWNTYMEEWKNLYKDSAAEESEYAMKLYDSLNSLSKDCFDHAGKQAVDQTCECVLRWKKTIKEAKHQIDNLQYDKLRNSLIKAEGIMKKIIDSFDDRDTKQNDRDLVFAAVDIVI